MKPIYKGEKATERIAIERVASRKAWPDGSETLILRGGEVVFVPAEKPRPKSVKRKVSYVIGV